MAVRARWSCVWCLAAQQRYQKDLRFAYTEDPGNSGFTGILGSPAWALKSFDPSTCSLKHYLCPTNGGKGLGLLKLLRLAFDSVLLGVGIPKITHIITVKTNIPITSDSVPNDQSSHLQIINIQCILKLHGSVRRTNRRYLI